MHRSCSVPEHGGKQDAAHNTIELKARAAATASAFTARRCLDWSPQTPSATLSCRGSEARRPESLQGNQVARRRPQLLPKAAAAEEIAAAGPL